MNDKTSAAKSAEVVRGLCWEVERISGELQKARAWARLWKRAAKVFRRMAIYYHNLLYDNTYTGALKEENDRKDAEIERYREALLPFAELAATIEKHNAVPAALAPWWGDLINAAATLEANHDTD